MKVQVTLVDGPCFGMVRYGSPLPQTLVVYDKATRTGWHDYTQTHILQRYRHSAHCKCRVPILVNLDVAR